MVSALLRPRREPIDQRPPVRVNGHRGYSHRFPENTIPSLRAAVERGATGLEFDVQLTRDGHVVAMHDSTLRRTTDVRRHFPDRAGDPVNSFIAEEIAQLDAGSWKHRDHVGIPVPMLPDIMHAFRGVAVRMSIELKATTVPAHAVASAVLDAVAGRDDVTIMSFRRPLIDAVLAECPGARVALISRSRPTAADLARYDEFHLDAKIATSNLVARIHDSGRQVTAWTVDSTVMARRLAALGVDAITTNRVDVIGAAVAT